MAVPALLSPVGLARRTAGTHIVTGAAPVAQAPSCGSDNGAGASRPVEGGWSRGNSGTGDHSRWGFASRHSDPAPRSAGDYRVLSPHSQLSARPTVTADLLTAPVLNSPGPTPTTDTVRDWGHPYFGGQVKISHFLGHAI